MSTALVVNGGNAMIAGRDYSSRDVIETIKKTVAVGASDAELAMFLELAKTYQLDPFLRQIWCVKMGGGMTIMTSRDGYLSAAMRDPNYDGIASCAVCEGDDFSFEPMTPAVTHKFGAKRGKVIGAYAAVFHKSRRPVICYASMDEYKGNSPVWQKYPSAMIIKVAEVFALKRQFGINGMVTKEEMDYATPEETEPAGTTTVMPEAAPEPAMSMQHRKNVISSSMEALGQKAFNEVVAGAGYDNVNDLAGVSDAEFTRVRKLLVTEYKAIQAAKETAAVAAEGPETSDRAKWGG